MIFGRSLQSRGQSVAFRLVVVLALVTAIAIVATVIAAYRYGRAAADEAFDRLLTGAALQISERVFVADGKVQVDLPLSAFELLALASDDRVFYRVRGATGETVTGYDDLPLPAQRRKMTTPLVYDTEYRGVPVRAVILQRRLAETQLRSAVDVIVAHTTQARADLARDIATRAMLGAALGGIVVIAATFFATRYALRPLGRIEEHMLARDPLDLSPITEAAPKEVDALVSAINRFMSRLDRRVGDMQAFVADTAHQMRTPITALRAVTENALDETDPGRLKSMLHRIRNRAIGVSRLMEQLLSEALIIHRSDSAPLVPTDLRRVVLDAEREFRTTVRPEHDALELDLSTDAATVLADPFSLKEAVKNLIANAFAHGQPPVRLVVETEEGGTALLRVEDHGPGIDGEQLKLLGRRFSRREDRTESAGLGLAIAHKVIAFHDATFLTGRSEKDYFWIGFRIALAKETTT